MLVILSQHFAARRSAASFLLLLLRLLLLGRFLLPRRQRRRRRRLADLADGTQLIFSLYSPVIVARSLSPKQPTPPLQLLLLSSPPSSSSASIEESRQSGHVCEETGLAVHSLASYPRHTCSQSFTYTHTHHHHHHHHHHYHHHHTTTLHNTDHTGNSNLGARRKRVQCPTALAATAATAAATTCSKRGKCFR